MGSPISGFMILASSFTNPYLSVFQPDTMGLSGMSFYDFLVGHSTLENQFPSSSSYRGLYQRSLNERSGKDRPRPVRTRYNLTTDPK